MADWHQRYTENIKGPYFVDMECIGCETCTQLAPDYFKLTSDMDHAYIYCQPSSEQSRQECEQALSKCPVDAIGVSHGE